MDKIPELHPDIQTHILAKLQDPLKLVVNSLLRLSDQHLPKERLEHAFIELAARLTVSAYLTGWEEAYDLYKTIKIDGLTERRKAAKLIESFLTDFNQFIAKQAQAIKEAHNSGGHGNNRLKRLEP